MFYEARGEKENYNLKRRKKKRKRRKKQYKKDRREAAGSLPTNPDIITHCSDDNTAKTM